MKSMEALAQKAALNLKSLKYKNFSKMEKFKRLLN